VNNDDPIVIATNKQCKTQTNNQFVHNGKETACHEQNQAISNCRFAREQSTRLHQKLKTTDGWADGEHARTQLLHQFLASAEAEHGWSPVRTEREWRKERKFNISEQEAYGAVIRILTICSPSQPQRQVWVARTQ